jgi:hypothetical protein
MQGLGENPRKWMRFDVTFFIVARSVEVVLPCVAVQQNRAANLVVWLGAAWCGSAHIFIVATCARRRGARRMPRRRQHLVRHV